MFSLSSMPYFNENNWGYHKPTASSPLSSSPIRAPTPLSPVHGNSIGQRNCFSSPPEPKSRFAARQTKPNPLVRKREEGQQTRRQLFLKNVRGRADEKAFERRSIEGHAIRRWHEEQQQIFQQRENDAAGMPTERDIEDAANLADQQFSQQIFEDVDSLMADEAARQEQLELEALLASYESPIPVSNAQPFSQRPPSIYISDDEEYDQIFMELAGDETVLVEDMEMS